MSWYKQLGKAFREVRLIVSGVSNTRSDGARAFIKQHYGPLLAQSPRPNFVVRECEGVDSYAVFRYDFGVEKKFPLDNLTAAQIEEMVQGRINEAEKVNKSL